MDRTRTDRILTVVEWTGLVLLMGLTIWGAYRQSPSVHLWFPLLFAWGGLFRLTGVSSDTRGRSRAYRYSNGLLDLAVAALYAGLWLFRVPPEGLAAVGFFLLMALGIWMAAAAMREQELDREKQEENR